MLSRVKTIETGEVELFPKEYIEAALENAEYELIEDNEPYYGEIKSLKGGWAPGKTLKECRRNLIKFLYPDD